MGLNQYQVVGRKVPTETDPAPQIFRMRIFAPNEVTAKSRFWYFLHQYSKMKRSTGEILSVSEIRERNNRIVRNYGITIKYNSRSGTHNMYKEFRDTSLCGAVEKMYQDLAGRHRARFSSIQIIDAVVVPAGIKATKKFAPTEDDEVPPPAVVRPSVKQFLDSKIKFPLAHRITRPASKAFRKTFAVSRPTTFFS
uniref:60S ribosomal protein L18a n=1 Tax=Pseudictyota dubia TaxID=2749911 RepID=A0A7R9ZDU8_9STRA|eukprot:TRINITY_DN6392_c0_g2_i1.p1 TRINITY_DN6392_c0_g2~~TRINITY_DN6392_c0_g2_i1.p1  ORF type:complete len:204 (+),score=38.89 TRINITY_DN6392_c0_g2_i1:28-612(+)